MEMEMRGESIIEYSSSSSSSSSHIVDGSEKRKKMTQLCRKVVVKWRVVGGGGVSILQELFRFIWDKIMVCSIGKPIGYRRLSTSPNPSPSFYDHPTPTTIHPSHNNSNSNSNSNSNNNNPVLINGYNSDSDSDLVCLKICLLGDCHIGKTSFMIKYVGDEQGTRCLETKGLNLTDKTLLVGGARIAVSVWDVGGDYRSRDQLPIACRDAVAILFMFDLTSRCTLNSVLEWYNEARRWNQSAIPILVGTKFDDFVQLPRDIQWTIVTQARGYARAMKATLFFSSATHNINVNKIFKFIMAKLFNLQWSLHRNLNPGEPIIDF